MFPGFSPDVAKNVMARACKAAGIAALATRTTCGTGTPRHQARPRACRSTQASRPSSGTPKSKSMTLDVWTRMSCWTTRVAAGGGHALAGDAAVQPGAHGHPLT